MISFYFSRGRPRTVSLDSEGKIPKKRSKKKRQMKFVDDVEVEDLEANNSDFSNDDLEPHQHLSDDNVVTCTVTTTGLTGTAQNGFNNGSLLGENLFPHFFGSKLIFFLS